MAGINEELYYPSLEAGFYIVTLGILVSTLPVYISLFVLFPLVLKVYLKLISGVCRSYRRIDGKTVIVTGANIGIGLETAKDLAKRGGRIIIACRNIEKGKEALEEVKGESGSNDVVLKYLDLSSLDSVRKFCKEIQNEESRLDILINNAGILPIKPTKELTVDKLESCMQTNHFAPFLLTNLLLELMRKTGTGRIVNVSSEAHKFVRTLDVDNWNCEKEFPSIFRVYAMSKLANIYFTTELNRRLQAKGIQGITVNALHPGAVRSAFLINSLQSPLGMIGKFIIKFFHKNAVEGAQTSVYVAVSEDLENVSGQYFIDCAPSSPTKLSQDSSNAQDLWEKSLKAVGLKPEETIL